MFEMSFRKASQTKVNKDFRDGTGAVPSKLEYLLSTLHSDFFRISEYTHATHPPMFKSPTPTDHDTHTKGTDMSAQVVVMALIFCVSLFGTIILANSLFHLT